MKRHPCLMGSLIGLVVGVAIVVSPAYAQEPASAPIVAASQEAELLLRLLSSGGLPAVLVLLGYWLPSAARGMIKTSAEAIATELREGVTVSLAAPDGGLPVRLSPESMSQIARAVTSLEALHRRVDVLAAEVEGRPCVARPPARPPPG